MPVVRAQPQLRRGGALRQPPAVRDGRDPVLAAVQEQRWRADLSEVEPPGGDVGQLVVHLPVRAALQGLPGYRPQPGPGALDGGVVCRGELFRVPRGGCQVGLHRCAAGRGGAQPRLAGGRHAANQSSPWASDGAIATTQTTPTTCCGSSAPQARACEPPPEWPMTANCLMPRASATLETSAAAEAMSRPG